MPTGKYTAADLAAPAGKYTAADIAPTAAPVAKNTASMTAAKPQTWLQDAESDLRYGGKRTLLGKIGGMMQGDSDKGYSGIGGVSPAGDMMASPLLGLLHAGQSAQSTPEHPVKGPLGVIGGLAEAATIPGMMVAGPGGNAVSEAIPSAKRAGSIFDSVLQDASNSPVTLTRTLPVLDELKQLGKTGSTLPKVVNQLAARAGIATKEKAVPLLRAMQNELSGVPNASSQTEPLLYPEARSFYTNVTNQSVADKLAQNGPMRGAMGNLREAFKQDIGDAAGVVGRGEDYAKAMKEFAQAKALSGGAKIVGKYLGGTAAGAIGAGGLYELFKKFL